MQQLQEENLQLQLIDTTSVFGKQINTNCHFDGSTLVYLAGAHILFHNVFQNGKQFMERVSDNQVLALAFHHSGDLTVLLVTRDTACHVQFYFFGKKSVVVDIHEDLQILDAIFLQKKRVCLLSYDKSTKSAALLIVTSHKKIKRVELPEKCFKLSTNERKVYIIAQSGCFEMNIQSEMLERRKLYQGMTIKNAIITQSDYDILFDNKGQCHLMQDNRPKHLLTLSEQFEKEKVEYQSAVRIGNNLLVAVKGEFVLAHYIIDENKLQFSGKFEYSEKVRGNIVALQSSLDEMNLAVALQTTHKDQVRIEHFLFNLSALSNEKKFINPFVRLHSGGEAGEVSSLQCIIPSEIFCLTGPHVINYSYVQHIEKKHKYSIHESPRSIAVHPLGHQLLCIFETAFKFYQKVEMELVQTWTESIICSCARYTDSGLLVLCAYQDGAHNMVVYNPNSYRRIRTFTGIYLKHAISRIDFDENCNELVLYAQKDLLIHKFKTGERLSEFREKREMTDVNCIEYDSIRRWLLVASKKNIIICKKTEEYLLNFNSQKAVRIDYQVTCIHLNQNAQTIFFGTSTGCVLFAPYPLQLSEETIDDQKVFRAAYTTVKVHSQPLADIILTNNCKFLFTAIKGDGLSILRVKKTAGGKGRYNPFDISNYNFIQTSSTPYLDNVHEKLKGLLEKRKTIFNELDQFKNQWENKRIAETKGLAIDNKRKQLNYINNALTEINKCKAQHAALLEELSAFESTAEKAQAENEKNHHKQLLACYEQNDRRKNKLREVQTKCRTEWEDISNQCVENLADIHSQLQVKFRHFQSAYLMMKENLLKYRRRVEIEGEQDRAVREEQMANTKLHLKNEEDELLRRNNELKGEITKNRKELERFINRKDFLQNKKRFFVEELKYCDYEQTELVEVKENLEKQLADLENVTHKKEKRLRKYFLENQVLIKYQLIHDNLTRQSNKETEFIEEQHGKLRQNIGALQREILHVSEERQKHKKQLAAKKSQLEQGKMQNQKLKQKREFLALQVRQIEDSIEATNTGKIVDEQSKNQDFLAIYQTYFVDKQLQTFLSNREAKTDDLIMNQNKKSEEGVKTVLQDHKQYLVSNMQLFQKYNTRVMDEINLTYLKYQTENYDLISECNIRKEQINKKKRILHQLVDQIRDTNNSIAAMQHSRPIQKQPPQPPPQLPFPLYEQQKQQEMMELRKDKSESAMWKIKKSSYQVRKMLEIQKLKGPGGDVHAKSTRRIQTAVLKKKPLQSSHQQGFAEESLDVINPMGYLQESKKPQTAFHRYRKKQNLEAKRLFSRNKSSSKPTTCTSHTKSKQSLFF